MHDQNTSKFWFLAPGNNPKLRLRKYFLQPDDLAYKVHARVLVITAHKCFELPTLL
uniref:Uncharacterized protein n=1 Tax=Solanum lycopersicum TaxID=4081 RepID=K4DEL3_SOLLC